MWDYNSQNILVEVFTVKDEVKDVFPIFKEINSAEPVSVIDLINEDDDSIELPTAPNDELVHLKGIEQNVNLNDDKPNDLHITTDSEMPIINNISLPTNHNVLSGSNSTSDTVTPATEVSSTSDLARNTVEVTNLSAVQSNSVIMTHKQIKTIIDKTCQHFHEKYQSMFKPSKLCKIPHINIDNMREDLYENNVVHKYPNTLELINHIESINSKLAMRSTKEWAVLLSNYSEKTKSDALQKSRSNMFYLGMDKQWWLVDYK